MATLKEIKQRIGSIKNTQKITKAMKMVAAAKMRRAQDRMFSARPYSSKVRELIQRLTANVENPESPLLQVRPIEKTLYVVVAADRGLCGGFNSNLIKKAVSAIRNDASQVSVFCVGKKSFEYFKKRDFNVSEDMIGFFNQMDYTHAEAISKYVSDAFISGEVDAVKLVFNEFKSVAQQVPVVVPLLPMVVEDDDDFTPVDCLYEPSQVELLKSLLPKYLNTQVWRSLLESFASEQAARMLAMDNATENASELIRSLTLQFNKARQAAITTEILEIVGGAEALKSS